MYARDVPQIREWALDHPEGPEHIRDLITFAILTIQVQFSRVAQDMGQVRRLGAEAPVLWGNKRAGYEYASANMVELHGDLWDADTHTAMAVLTSRVPSLGFAKGAFVAQMLGHPVVCLDIRNLTDLGAERRMFRDAKGMSPKQRDRTIERYLRYSESIGGAEMWWDHWCTGIAPQMGMSPERVSRLHYTIPAGLERLNERDERDQRGRITKK